ncbi:hypothetical protein K474DRAFT_1650455 [Panus rudis PR-1116 ss-1]|nr:hypothetical protein K474DRAFT_1650455 [Panus rudis PR-1116 ss-1]
MSNDFHLSITRLKLSELPSEETVLAAGRAVLDSSSSWKEGKTFHRHGTTVRTFAQPKGPQDGAGWHCRVSEHTAEDATFDEFWAKLGVDKAENEKEFVHEIKKVKLVKQISPTQSVWTLYYTFPPPVAPRVFTVLQTVHLDNASPRTGIIVSIPIDLSSDPELAELEEKGVKGRYTSVERIKELENGKVEWRMATSSTPGGNIPQFITERTMPGKISADVPQFIQWFHTIRAKDAKAGSASAEVRKSTSEAAAVPAVSVAEGAGPGAA